MATAQADRGVTEAEWRAALRKHFKNHRQALTRSEGATAQRQLRTRIFQRKKRFAHRMVRGWRAYCASHGISPADEAKRMAILIPECMPELLDVTVDGKVSTRCVNATFPQWLSAEARQIIANARRSLAPIPSEAEYVEFQCCLTCNCIRVMDSEVDCVRPVFRNAPQWAVEEEFHDQLAEVV